MIVFRCVVFRFLWTYDSRFAWSAFASRISRVHSREWRLWSNASVLSLRYVSVDARFKLSEAPFDSYRGSGYPIHSILLNSLLCPRLLYFAMALLDQQERGVTEPDS